MALWLNGPDFESRLLRGDYYKRFNWDFPRSTEVRDKISNIKEELLELDQEQENFQGEKNQKYKELKLKEIQIDEFFDTYEQNKADEEVKKSSNLQKYFD